MHAPASATTDSQDSSSTPYTEVDHHPTQPSQLLNLEFCKKYGLTDDDIDMEVEDGHIKEIYCELENWERVAYHLGLSGPDIAAIKAENNTIRVKRLYTLQEWKKKGKFDGVATYRVLLEALRECDCSNLVLRVCELLQKKKASIASSH